MSILEKYSSAFMSKDEAAMNEVLHEDYQFTMHSSGNILSKQDVIKWALSDDMNRNKVNSLWKWWDRMNTPLLLLVTVIFRLLSQYLSLKMDKSSH